MKKEKTNSLSKDYLFERLNSKYNRLWEQMTSLAVLCIEIIAGFSFAVLAIGTSKPDTYIKMNYITLIIFVIILGLALCIGRLEYERTETKRGLLTFVTC